MTNLIIQFMEATTTREVDRIVEQNIEAMNPFNREFICKFANNAKRRIKTLQREKMKCTEIIYLN